MLDPSTLPFDNRSPRKQVPADTTPPRALFTDLNHIPLPRPEERIFRTDSPEKNSQPAWSYSIAPPMADTAVFGPLPALASVDQENIHQLPHSDNCAAFPDFANGYNSPKAKRAHANSEPSRIKKGKATGVDAHAQSQLPSADDLPLPEDTGKKPSLSYAQLIGMAILRSPERRKTLSQIYTWISESFSFYGSSPTPTGWQNSIRHNLSISDAFAKQERSKDDPGKGHYWIIVPGKEGKFLKQKSGRRPQSAGAPAMKTFAQPLNEPSSSAWSMPAPAAKKSILQISGALDQPSSDGTIPESEANSPKYQRHGEIVSMLPPASRLACFSPSPVIGSSPPVEHAEFIGPESPLLASDPLFPETQTRAKKRKSTAMDDSGYWSSLESSTARQHSTAKGLNNVALEKARLKRGRAEEEIARIRSSSHDISPSKTRPLAKQPTPELASSSPLHGLELPPLTPSFTFKPPQKLLASVSPGTSLRAHRDQTEALLGSPIRDIGPFHAGNSASPMFNILDEECYAYDDGLQRSFEIFHDMTAFPHSHRLSPSPKKRSARPNRLARPCKTGSALADVTGIQLNRKTLASTLKDPYLDSPIRPHKSAIKIIDIDENTIQYNGDKEEFLNYDIFADENDEPDEFDGLDILQGFKKIGGNKKSTPKVKKSGRPALGARSNTSCF